MRAAASAALAALAAGCAALHVEPPPPATLNVVHAPSPVPAGGRVHLAFELALANAGPETLTLESVAVSGPSVAITLTGEALGEALRRSDRPAAPGFELPPRSVTPVFLWIASGAPPSGPLAARAAVRGGPGGDDDAFTLRATVEIDPTPPLVLAPPVRGGPWLVLAGAGGRTAHRRHVHVSWKQPYLAQRFALDLVRLDGEQRNFAGDPAANESHHAWGADVLAGIDAVVARTVDGIPDNVGGPRERAVEMLMRTVAGNHVVLDAGDGRYVVYAHLAEGSVAVREGERVRPGQVLGRLGNSGNSTEPHLHVHVADAADPLEAQGLPFVFETFTVERISTRRPARHGTAGPGPRTHEIPLDGDVVSFPDR